MLVGIFSILSNAPFCYSFCCLYINTSSVDFISQLRTSRLEVILPTILKTEVF